MRKAWTFWRRHQVFVRWAVTLALAFYAVSVAGDGRDTADRTATSVRANCTVLTVLLENRSDRKQTTKLFEPIRRQNPKQFDKLVARAEKGDERLAKVKDDLACDVP